MNASPPMMTSSGVSPADLAIGLRVLADLLEAELPLAKSLGILETMAPPAWGPALPGIRRAIREGQGLARALEGSPLAMPPLVVGIIRAGEAAGGLARATRQAAEETERAAAARAAVRQALAYPAIIAATGVASVTIMLSVVLPRFTAALAELGQELPPATKALVTIGNVVRVAGLPALVVLTALALLLARWIATTDGRRRTDAFLLRVPVIGGIRAAWGSARYSTALAALLEGGVPIRAAIATAAHASGDAEIAARAISARSRVAAGESLSSAFGALGVLTPGAVRLIAAGEESGRLAGMLSFAARVEERRATALTVSLVRLIEPSVILALALLVGFVASAMLRAIYAVRPT